MGQWVPLCCTAGVEIYHCNGCVKFEFNAIRCKNDYEQKWSVNLDD